MGKATPLIGRLNGGELAPAMLGRPDTDAYRSGVQTCRNWLPVVQGGVTRRPGTRDLGPAKLGIGGAMILPFIFSSTTAYMLELGILYLRIWTPEGQLIEQDDTPLELETPWDGGHLTSEDDGPGLDSAQSGDVMWLVHEDVPPQLLKRNAPANWTLEPFEPTAGPFADVNADDSLTITASGTSGTITLTASSDLFFSELIGRPMRLRSADPAAVVPWEPDRAVNAGMLRRVDSRVYEALNTETTRSVTPVHEEGEGSDGKVTWLYRHAGRGIVKITEVASPTSATAEVVGDELPDDLTSEATPYWELPAWNDRDGWPSAVTFFRERLVFARGRDLHFSRAGDFWDFSDHTAGDTLADDAITLTIASDRVEVVRWLLPMGQRLVIGTPGGELVCQELTSSDPFGPGNVGITPSSDYGVRDVPPVRYGTRAAFMQGRGRKVRELAYSFDTDALEAADLTILAAHITAPSIVQLAWQDEPDSVLWALRSDGVLLSCTREIEHQVTGWARHPMARVVEAIAVLPHGGEDRLWLMVNDALYGGDEPDRRVLLMDPRHEPGGEPRAHLDLYVESLVDATGRVDGLDHLEGLEAGIAAAEADSTLEAHRPLTVSGGAVTLDHTDYARARIGLRYLSVLETMPLDAGFAFGTGQTRPGRVHALAARVLDTSAALRAGEPGETRPFVKYQLGHLRSGDHRIASPSGFATRMVVRLEDEGPLPATVVALVPELVGYD